MGEVWIWLILFIEVNGFHKVMILSCDYVKSIGFGFVFIVKDWILVN